MTTPGGLHGDPHFIRVHAVQAAAGVSDLGLWEAAPTGWNSVFRNVPSETGCDLSLAFLLIQVW